MNKGYDLYNTEYPRSSFQADILQFFHTSEKIISYSYVSGNRNIRFRPQLPTPDYTAIHPHYHSSFEFLFVCGGEMEININDTSYHIKGPEVFFVNPYEHHSGKLYSDSQDVEYIAVMFDFEILKSLNEQYSDVFDLIESGKFKLDNIISDESIKQKFLCTLDDIMDYSQRKQFGWEMCVRGLINCLFGSLLSGMEKDDEACKTGAQGDFIRKVNDYIEENLKEKITLEAVAAYIGYNPKYFCRLFKEYTHQNFNKYVCKMRINRAKEMMGGNDSISYIAGDCGFYNFSYFAKKFKEHTGCSPSDYKTSINGRLN